MQNKAKQRLMNKSQVFFILYVKVLYGENMANIKTGKREKERTKRRLYGENLEKE